jgi:hypothetical protein
MKDRTKFHNPKQWRNQNPLTAAADLSGQKENGTVIAHSRWTILRLNPQIISSLAHYPLIYNQPHLDFYHKSI